MRSAMLFVILAVIMPRSCVAYHVSLRAGYFSRFGHGVDTAVRHAAVHCLAESEEARRERLRQLFGEDSASKIADRTAAPKKKAAEEPVPEIQMLIEGMQELDWGQIRLIDVDMAPGPLELTLSPLLEDSKLLCVRLDMRLGCIAPCPG